MFFFAALLSKDIYDKIHILIHLFLTNITAETGK